MAQGVAVVACVLGLMHTTVVIVDRTTAYTTLRLWHRLHTAEGVEHDFGHVFAPDADSRYQSVAAVHNKEYVRALARCRRESLYRLRFDALASAPHDEDCCEALVAAMLRANYRPDWDVLRRHQPRWALACAYHA
jgi:hypothetical protein